MSKSLKKLVEESREKNQPEVDMSDRGISNMLDVHGLCECRGPALPLEGLEGRVSFPSNCRPLCERLSWFVGHPLLVNITVKTLAQKVCCQNVLSFAGETRVGARARITQMAAAAASQQLSVRIDGVWVDCPHGLLNSHFSF